MLKGLELHSENSNQLIAMIKGIASYLSTLREKLKRANSIQILSATLFLVFFIGLLMSLTFFFNAYPTEGLNLKFDTKGYEYFKSHFSPSIEIMEVTFKFMVSVATIGGIFIAVKSYYSNQYSSSISNHIANTKTFADFVKNEASKCPLVSNDSISPFLWYNEIFPNSKSGNLEVSGDYLASIRAINKVINNSNTVYMSSDKPDFSYQKHQTQMIAALNRVGFQVARLSRNNFYACESEVLGLIQLTNIEFCGIKECAYMFEDRKYI